jgi:hypothetical protein
VRLPAVATTDRPPKASAWAGSARTASAAPLFCVRDHLSPQKPPSLTAQLLVATFRRKIDGFVDFDRWRDAKRSP